MIEYDSKLNSPALAVDPSIFLLLAEFIQLINISVSFVYPSPQRSSLMRLKWNFAKIGLFVCLYPGFF